MIYSNFFRYFITIGILVSSVHVVIAQDVEPRRWTPIPVGVHVVGIGYAYSTGELLLDPVLQIENAKVNIHAVVAQYVQPFKIGNNLARLDVTVPYAIGHWEGFVAGEPTIVYRNGFADPRVRVSMNFVGPKAMGPKEMQEYMLAHPVSTTFGASLGVTLPLGQYFDDKLINLGQNRFILRPQIGMVHNWRQWSFELTGSAFIYTNNTNFFNGKTRRQSPIYALQTHLIKRFKNRVWASASLAYGSDGKTTIDGEPKDDLRINGLAAFSLGFPILKNQSVKINYLRTQTFKDVGSDTDTFALAWSLVF